MAYLYLGGGLLILFVIVGVLWAVAHFSGVHTWRPRKKELRLIVVITYKSGKEVIVSCTKMEVKRDPESGTLAAVGWTNIRPEPLHLNVDAVESIWKIGERWE